MKKHLLLLIAASSFITAGAQITLTQADIATAGNTFRRGNDTIFSGIIGPGGTNMTWNYTGSLDIDYVDTISFVNPNTLPSFSTFPTSNIGIKFGSFADGYGISSPTSLSLIGQAGTFFGVYGELEFTDPEKLMEFPCTFGTTYTDYVEYGAQVEYTTTGVDSVRLKTMKNKSVNVDGWGSLTTLSGTYNVLRQMEYTTQIDSIWIHTPGFPPIVPPSWQFYTEQLDTTYHYAFWSNGTGYPVAEIDSSYNATAGAFEVTANWILAPGVSLKENNTVSGSLVYPNPAADAVTIRLTNAPQTNYEIEVYTAIGTVVKRADVSGAKNVVAIDELSPGFYLYRAVSKEGAVLGQGKFQKN
ncbi:MAG: hypothetical protein K0S33_3649 [Bacteroidetes bacterium]|jgi:hypothetical protein|nr:hypothetical protein [Bacteroidota bacterium]